LNRDREWCGTARVEKVKTTRIARLQDKCVVAHSASWGGKKREKLTKKEEETRGIARTL